MSQAEVVKRLLNPMSAVYLATTRDDGRPDVRAMAPIKAEGCKVVWFLTGVNSDKYQELTKNPNCTVYATHLEDDANYLELRLWGRVELLNDANSRSTIWNDNYLCYFPGGKDDPALRVLKFTADSGTVQTQKGKEKIIL